LPLGLHKLLPDHVASRQVDPVALPLASSVVSNRSHLQLSPRLGAQLAAEAVVAQRLPSTLTGLNQPQWNGIQLRRHPAALAADIGKPIFLHLQGSSSFVLV
jgi:hypothetical protein